MLCVLLVLTGCQKRQEQTDIRLPESDSAVTEETITEPTEKAEEALSEESHAEQEPQSTVPDLGDYENLCAVLQTLQTLDDWKSSPEYEMITAQKGKSSQSTDSQLLPRAGQPQSSGYRMGRP